MSIQQISYRTAFLVWFFICINLVVSHDRCLAGDSTDPAVSPAGNSSEEDESIVLETTVVTASRPDEIPPHERTSSSVNVIQREDIPDRKADLGEILSREVGIDVRQYGGMGAFSEVFIRGSSSEQVSIYVDGIPYSASGSGRVGLGTIATGAIEKVEVYRGSAPGAFGAGAIGGVINITTTRPDSEPGIRASASYGSFGTNHQNLNTTFGLGENHGFSVSLGRHASENDFQYEDNRGTPNNDDDDETVTRENADYEALNTGASWEWNPSSTHRISAGFSYNTIEKGVPGLGSRPALNARLSSDTCLGRLKYDYGRLFDSQMWVTRENRLFDDPDDEAGRKGRQKTHTDIDMWGVLFNISPVTGPVFSHIQLEYKKEEFRAEDDLDESSQSLPSIRHYLGAGLEPEIMVIPERMWITPRIHAAYVEDELQDTGIRLAGEDSDETRTVERTPVSYSLGWRYMLSRGMTLHSTVGRYTRLPEFNELFGDTGDVVGNPDLEEEVSINIDAGVHVGSRDTLFEGDLTYFHRFSEDLIQRRSYGDYLIAENIGKARVDGVEASLKGRSPDRRYSCSASITYQYALNKSDETTFRRNRYYDKELPYHPRWQAAGSVGYRPVSRLLISGEVLYRSESYTGPSNLEDEKLDEAVVYNLSATLSLGERWTVILDAENLTDDRTVDRWGYPKPGRGFYMTMKFNY